MKKLGFFKSIQFKFVLIYTLLMLLAMQFVGVFFTDQMENSAVKNFNSSLKQETNLLSYNIGKAIKESKEASKTDQADLRNKIKDLLAGDNIRNFKVVEVLDQTGTILATSDPQKKNDVGRRTNSQFKMRKVLTASHTEINSRRNDETGEKFQVATTPIVFDNTQYGLLYIEKSMDDVYSNLYATNKILATGTVLALILTAFLGFFLAKTITKPLAQMQRQAMAISQGNFSRKVQKYDEDEIGQLALSFNNMTEKLKEANATTESERRKLRSVLAYMTDGVIATDRDGHVILMNNRSEELLGVYRQNVLGQSIIELLKLQEDYTVSGLYKIEDAINLDFSSEDKKEILRANFSVIKKDNGAVNGIIAVLHDVTEQEIIEMERREFVSNVSHELRTPLTTMRSYLEALQDGAVLDEILRTKFLDVTQTETERMIRLVNDLLQLSKLDAKDYTIEQQRTDFVEFLNRIIDRFEMSKKQNIRIKRNLPKNAIIAYIDRDKLTQVIDNIISNAMKYSPEGGAITFRILRVGDFLKASISDQGVGIPKDNLDKVFRRFYRVDRARSRKLGGTGLGLAIAKEMIEAHGGKIWAESEWNKGTTIIFTLPLFKEDQKL